MSASLVPPNAVSVDELLAAKYFEAVDVHFARFCLRHAAVQPAPQPAAQPAAQPAVQPAAQPAPSAPDSLASSALALVFAEVSRALRVGHPCVSLPDFCGAALVGDDGESLGAAPQLETVLPLLAESACVTRIGAAPPGPLSTPLALDDERRLYLTRYFEHERLLAEGVARLLGNDEVPPDDAWLKPRLEHYFPATASDGGPDLQRQAAAQALRHRLSVVSGGPGTGKTSTVVKMLALFSELALARKQTPPRVLLLSPTGKAAARLVESIASAVQSLDIDEVIAGTIAREASTIHRALGTSFASATRFLRGPGHPLLADVVLVDEASMVDLSLMRHLVCALHDDARLILLGDRHQLASVEAGSVLAELCSALAGRKCLVELKKSYRFSEDSSIAALATAVKEGKEREAVSILRAGRKDLVFRGPIEALSVGRGAVSSLPQDGLEALVIDSMGRALRHADPATVLLELERFRLLCAHRRGPFGVQTLNETVRKILVTRGFVPESGEFYRGRLVMVAHNDYPMGLSNGDIGLCWPDENGRLVVYFPTTEGGLRAVSPSQLPEHETAFALTIHKSQGSEYEQVAIVLPPESSPLLTRELLYTAITRAKKRAIVFGSEAAVHAACSRTVARTSGLGERLLGLL